MSWSEGRTKDQPRVTKVKLQELIDGINNVLLKLSKDNVLHDNLKDPEVRKAIDHWTGKHRLAPEEATRFEENKDVIYVLQRLQILQAVCRDCLISIPIDLFFNRSTSLHPTIIELILKEHGYTVNEFYGLQSDSSKVTDTKKKEEGEKKKEKAFKPDSNNLILQIGVFAVLGLICAVLYNYLNK